MAMRCTGGRPGSHRHKLLVIDDDEDCRDGIRLRLKAAGYEVCVAADGHDVTGIVEREGIELVVTDIFMPHRDGIETIRTLRRMLPHVPIIAMSGGAVQYVTSARDLGAHRTFEKPIDLDELMAAVEELLHGDPEPRRPVHL